MQVCRRRSLIQNQCWENEAPGIFSHLWDGSSLLSTQMDPKLNQRFDWRCGLLPLRRSHFLFLSCFSLQDPQSFWFIRTRRRRFCLTSSSAAEEIQDLLGSRRRSRTRRLPLGWLLAIMTLILENQNPTLTLLIIKMEAKIQLELRAQRGAPRGVTMETKGTLMMMMIRLKHQEASPYCGAMVADRVAATGGGRTCVHMNRLTSRRAPGWRAVFLQPVWETVWV